jgi:hypothetical protein
MHGQALVRPHVWDLLMFLTSVLTLVDGIHILSFVNAGVWRESTALSIRPK